MVWGEAERWRAWSVASRVKISLHMQGARVTFGGLPAWRMRSWVALRTGFVPEATQGGHVEHLAQERRPPHVVRAARIGSWRSRFEPGQMRLHAALFSGENRLVGGS